MKSYQEKLLDPRWQKKRLEIFERDGWKCRICGTKEKTLHAHHNYYLSGKEIWEYEGNAIMTVCDLCHTGIHKHADKDEFTPERFLFYLNRRKKLADQILEISKTKKTTENTKLILQEIKNDIEFIESSMCGTL